MQKKESWVEELWGLRVGNSGWPCQRRQVERVIRIALKLQMSLCFQEVQCAVSLFYFFPTQPYDKFCHLRSLSVSLFLVLWKNLTLKLRKDERSWYFPGKEEERRFLRAARPRCTSQSMPPVPTRVQAEACECIVIITVLIIFCIFLMKTLTEVQHHVQHSLENSPLSFEKEGKTQRGKKEG